MGENDDNYKFTNLTYPTLANIVKQGPLAMRQMLDSTGQSSIRVGSESTTQEASQIETQRTIMSSVRKKHKAAANLPQRGEIFYHKKRGTKVTIIQACADRSEISGDPIHIVSESVTGKRFRALNTNLVRL